ncbi:hypothetical protein CPC08DRAFT_672333 [Agrocybe pediades]|nr:hypothetical protein CPC08DRAFT_672333 [Agrocybe pediades]
MGLEAAELARWTRFAAKGGIGKCTALCDCVAESPDDLMFLKDDEITVLYQLPDLDGFYLGYCEGVVGRFSGTDVRFHGKLKKPVMTKRSSVAASTIAKSPSPSPSSTVHGKASPITNDKDREREKRRRSVSSPSYSHAGLGGMGKSSPVPLPPSPASSPRPPSLSGRRSSGAAARWDSEGASSNAGLMERRASGSGSSGGELSGRRDSGGAVQAQNARRFMMSPLSSTVQNLEYDEGESEAKNRMPHMSCSSTSTAPDSAGVDTPLGSASIGGIKQDRQSDNDKVEKSEEREVKTSRRYGTPSPREFRFPQPPGSMSMPSSPPPPMSPPPQAALPPPPPHASLSRAASATASPALSSRALSPPTVHVSQSSIQHYPTSSASQSQPQSFSSSSSSSAPQPSQSPPPPQRQQQHLYASLAPSPLNLSPPPADASTSPLRIAKKSPTVGSLSSSASMSSPQLLSTPLNDTSAESMMQSFSQFDSSRDSYADNEDEEEDPRARFAMEEEDDAQGIGLSLLQDLGGGFGSDSDDSDGGGGGVDGLEGEDDAYRTALSRVGRKDRDSLDESTVEGLGYALASEDGHTQEGVSAFPQPPPLPTSVQHVQDAIQANASSNQQQHLSPANSPTAPSFSSSSRSSQPPPPAASSSNYFANRDRRPSNATILSQAAPSLNSLGAGSNSSQGEWEGYADIYDDYRYSRYSMASGKFSLGAGAGEGQEERPPVPELDGSRPSLDARPSLDGVPGRSSFESATRPPPFTRRVSKLKEHDRTMSVDSDASVYTQNSRLSTLSQDLMGMGAGSGSGGNTPTPPQQHQQQQHEYQNHRPAPLNLTQHQSQHQQPHSEDQHQPLLNTTWGSPLSSPGIDSPKSSSVMYTPLPGTVARGNARDSVSFSGGANGAMAMVSPTFGGFASAMRMRLEEEGKQGRAGASGDESQSRTGGEDETGAEESMVSGAGLGNRIVVEDEDELPSRVGMDSTFLSTTSMTNTEDGMRTPGSEVSAEGERERDGILAMGGLVQPARTEEEENSTSTSTSTSEANQEQAQPTASPPAPSHLRPAPSPLLAQLREGAGELVPGTNQRRSLFLPHPNAPKSPPAGVSTQGPMFIAAQNPQQVQMQLRPPMMMQGQGQYQGQPMQVQPGQVMPPHLQQQQQQQPRPQRPHLFAVIHQALSRPPPHAAPPPPVAASGKPPAPPLQRGPTIYGRTEGDLASASGPIPIVWSVDPPVRGATAPAGQVLHGIGEPVPGGGAGNPGGAGGGVGPKMMMGPPKRTMTLPPGMGPGQQGLGQGQGQQMGQMGPMRSVSLGAGAAAAAAQSSTSNAPPPPPPLAAPPSNQTSIPESRASIDVIQPPNPLKAATEHRASGSNLLPLPRANFTPRAGGVRPRSRSFSGFNTGGKGTTAEVVVPVVAGSSRSSSEEPILSSRDIKRSLTTHSSSSSSLSALNSPSPLSNSTSASTSNPNSLSTSNAPKPKPSPLRRPSPLSSSSLENLKPPPSPLGMKVPSSPLAKAVFVAGSADKEGNEGKEKDVERGKDGALKDGETDALASPPSSPPAGSSFSLGQARQPMRVASLQVGSRPDLANLRPRDNADNISILSTRSHQLPLVGSPPQGSALASTSTPNSQPVTRQTSLRSKLSLPNLRRKPQHPTRSATDDEHFHGLRSPSSPSTPSHSQSQFTHQNPPASAASTAFDSELLLQVQDMAFELVRPNLSYFQAGAARTSEDSGVLPFGGKGSMDVYSRGSLDVRGGPGAAAGDKAGERMQERPESPAMSVLSGSGAQSRFSEQRSPVAESASVSWPPSRVGTDTENLSSTSNTGTIEAHRNRELKWMSLLQSSPASQARKSKKVRKLLVEGVPNSVRYLVWSHLTDGKARFVEGVYKQLVVRSKSGGVGGGHDKEEMQRDIRELFADQPHLQGTQGPVVGLLQAYLSMVPDVRYSKGLTLIVGQLLLLAPEEDAFWIFVSIMDTHIRAYFSPSASSVYASQQMEVDAALFGKALEANDSAVARKLGDVGVDVMDVCAPWFSSLFVGVLPPEYLNRVWDMFLYEGVPFLIRVGLALLTVCCKRTILSSPSSADLKPLLVHPPQAWLPSTPEAFLSLAFGVKLKDEDIKKIRVKMKLEKEKEKVKRPTGGAGLAGGGISLPRSS